MSFFKFLITIVLLSVFSACQDNKTQKTTKKEIPTPAVKNSPAEKVVIPGQKERDFDFSKIKTLSQEDLKPFLRKYGKENPETKVRIKTDFGNIVVQLFSDTPLHRANFIHLVKLGYFNSTFFHRVDEGFVIQGGNSDKVFTQKIRAKVGDFLIPNEASPRHPHDRGTVSMAKYRKQNISDASSPFEFFIVQSKNGAHHLDGEHTVFGKVIEGMNVVDSINKVPTDDLEWPLRNVYMEIEIIE
ncbi:MAG TPA: peptidylprolyl isomerase [Flavobacteriaceae bacterium]|nr:peptidylprolyl isomerase [Flavobacteriaceae bacterium]